MLRRLPKLKVSANVFTYNSAISACEKGCSWINAVWLLCEMKMASLELDLVSYNAALSTCAVSTQWALTLCLMSEMTAQRLQMDVPCRKLSACALDMSVDHFPSGFPGRSRYEWCLPRLSLMKPPCKGWRGEAREAAASPLSRCCANWKRITCELRSPFQASRSPRSSRSLRVATGRRPWSRMRM